MKVLVHYDELLHRKVMVVSATSVAEGREKALQIIEDRLIANGFKPENNYRVASCHIANDSQIRKHREELQRRIDALKQELNDLEV